MAKRVAHYVTRPGKDLEDPTFTIPVAEDLVSVPGIPTRDNDVSFFSREYPLENMAIEESASAAWAREQRNNFSPEARAFAEEHQQHMEPIVEWVRTSGNLEPTGTPTGEDVTEAIRQKARQLGYGEVGFTYSDRHYVYQSRKPVMKPPAYPTPSAWRSSKTTTRPRQFPAWPQRKPTLAPILTRGRSPWS